MCGNYVKDGNLQVDAYEQGRPGYPLEAVNYALKGAGLDTGCKTIVDLAAGTGKLTRSASITVICHPVSFLSMIPRIAMPSGGCSSAEYCSSRVHACLQVVEVLLG